MFWIIKKYIIRKFTIILNGSYNHDINFTNPLYLSITTGWKLLNNGIFKCLKVRTILEE